MAKKKVSVPVEIVDAVAADHIATLEKKVYSLERKLIAREQKIQRLQGGIDISKERRGRLCTLAGDLVAELKDAGWAEYDDYYDDL